MRKYVTWIVGAMAVILGLGWTATILEGRSSPSEAKEEEPSREQFLEEVREILREVPLIDGHNDVPWLYRERVKNRLDEIDFAGDTSRLDPPMHTDIPRLRRGGVGGQFWSVYIPVDLGGPGAVRITLEQIDLVHRLTDRYSDTFEMAYTAVDVERIHRAGKIASLIGMEGGHSIENSLAALRQLYAAGARYMTLTHWRNTDWADAATDRPAHGGLTPFGREVVREMNRLGMLLDLSHVSPDTMKDALEVSEAPVIFSHSSARGVTDHPRNVPDEVLRLLPQNGGVVMVTFVPSFVSDLVRNYQAEAQGERRRLEWLYPGNVQLIEEGLAAWRSRHPEPRAILEDVADHIDHIRQVAGVDFIGLGSDFDGMSSAPVGLEDVSCYPALLAELRRRGYSRQEVAKIAGLNVLRVMRRAEEVAARLQGERPPSEALMEELDQEVLPAEPLSGR